jgi:hypothetical protein
MMAAIDQQDTGHRAEAGVVVHDHHRRHLAAPFAGSIPPPGPGEISFITRRRLHQCQP